MNTSRKFLKEEYAHLRRVKKLPDDHLHKAELISHWTLELMKQKLAIEMDIRARESNIVRNS